MNLTSPGVSGQQLESGPRAHVRDLRISVVLLCPLRFLPTQVVSPRDVS